MRERERTEMEMERIEESTERAVRTERTVRT